MRGSWPKRFLPSNHMSTATLTKPRAQEAAEPSKAVPPAQIYPARLQLTAKISEFEMALANLEDYRSKAARAQRDEEEALDNGKLTEGQAADSISRAQNLKAVYSSRTANKEKAIAALSSDLTNVIRQSHSELQGLVNREVERRREVIGARVLEVAGATDTNRPGLKPALADLLDYSEPILRVRALAPRPLITLSGNSESLVQSSKDVLEKYTAVIAEAAAENL